jgi:hypothetical protein
MARLMIERHEAKLLQNKLNEQNPEEAALLQRIKDHLDPPLTFELDPVVKEITIRGARDLSAEDFNNLKTALEAITAPRVVVEYLDSDDEFEEDDDDDL